VAVEAWEGVHHPTATEASATKALFNDDLRSQPI